MEDRKYKGLVWVIVLLIVLVLILASIIVYKDFFDENVKNNDSNLENPTTTEIKITTNKNEETYKINLKENYVDLGNYINFEVSSNKTINLEIIASEFGQKVYYKNFTTNATLCMDNIDKYNNLYIGDKLVYSQNYEACYLTLLQFIYILDNKYIIAKYSGESQQFILVFDKNGNLADNFSAIEIYYESNKILYKNYEENDEKYLLNLYSYDFVNGKRQTQFLKKGTESYCNQMDDIGYCE